MNTIMIRNAFHLAGVLCIRITRKGSQMRICRRRGCGRTFSGPDEVLEYAYHVYLRHADRVRPRPLECREFRAHLKGYVTMTIKPTLYCRMLAHVDNNVYGDCASCRQELWAALEDARAAAMAAAKRG